MYRHRIPKAIVNKLRQLFIAGPFNKTAAAAKYKISSATVFNYVAEFKKIGAAFPSQLKNMDFFMPNPVKSHRPTAMYVELIAFLNHFVLNIPDEGMMAVVVWRKYRDACSGGYAFTPFRRIYRAWCAENAVVCCHAKLLNNIPAADLEILQHWRRSDDLRHWRIAVVLHSAYERRSLTEICEKVEVDMITGKRWIRSYNQFGLAGFKIKKRQLNERAAEAMRQKSANITKLLQHSPTQYGIDRTSWTCCALATTYLKVYGVYISAACVGRYLNKSGYTYKKTREMLLSKDPKFDEKIERIQTILANLTAGEKFFSIDEFGPIGIKRRGGKSFVHESERPLLIPQFQKSKGTLTCVAALELSTNQVTHFFASRKDSAEMIKLIDLLHINYRDETTLYLSWDAASWHTSAKIKRHIKTLNSKSYRKLNRTPQISLAPLPSCAQYLNVIESVFKGMQRSVIDHSDYANAGECALAVDLYFSERNRHYLNDPKKAGNKIWGKEIVKPVFTETQHCKRTARIRQANRKAPQNLHYER